MRRFIVAGGPCVCNAEPLADFFDLLMLGEGEVQLPDGVRHHHSGAQRAGSPSMEILKCACAISKAFTCPRLYDVSYRPDGRV